jgi:alcohol dehydrogenase (cytochrome c)
MRARTPISIALACTVIVSAILYAADYSLTVSQDRLNNAQNEPQNWLLMNGDYGSQRYSKLTQINRDTVKNLRVVWTMALGGMQDIGQNGPEAEVNPLIDNGFMYTTDGWGTIYKIDARDPYRGKFVWVADPGVQHEGNTSRTRGIALWEDRVLANLPDGRVIAINRDNGEIVWDKKVAAKNEFGSQERFYTAPIVVDGKVLVQNGAGDGGTRGWIAALDVKTGNELWRFYTIPKPGDPGSETWKDDHNAWKTGGGGLWQTGSYDPVQKLYIIGTGNPYPIYDPQFRPGDNLYTNSAIAINVDTGKLAWHFQYTPNDSWDFDEVGVHMLYDTTIDGVKRKVVGHYARNGFFYSIDRTTGKFIHSEKYVNDLNWTKGIDQKTGKPMEYSPKLDVQLYNPEARALRGDGTKRTCPTWHGGGIDNKASQPRKYSSDLYYGAVTAFDAVNHKLLAKAVTDIEIRSGVTATAGGLVFSALQDGWIVAYNDETLEELWRFNIGTPLKGSPVTYAIGPKQYVAVQTSGRHLHPVKFDNLENSSFLFVFALN